MPTKREISAAMLSSKSLEEGALGSTSRSMRRHLELTSQIRSSQGAVRYSPSAYMAEMRLSTEERIARVSRRPQPPPQIIEFLDMAATSHAKDSVVDIDQPLFQPIPSEIVFQKYEPHQQYKVPLVLRNADKFARHLRVVQEDSPYFTLQCPKQTSTGKVAPGMDVTYSVVFTPDDTKDYTHELVCVTEREKFVIPVRGIGRRGVVDFPDEVHFPTAPVKYMSTKTVLIRNVGAAHAHFSLETSSPFSVVPSTVSLEVGSCMQVDIHFTPGTVGDHRGELVVRYDSGEEVGVGLYGGAVDSNVRLDRGSVKMDSTYISMSSQRSVVIHNRSDVVVHFEWKAFSSGLEEQAEKDMRSAQLTTEESIAKDALLEECFKDPGFRDRISILTRTFDHRKQYVDDDRFLYSDSVFLIEPLEGDIWPNSQAEVTIIFRPEEATSYSCTAYCDVTGRETRLPLKIKGEGLGPNLVFSYDSLNIQNVFLDSGHSYEVVLENRGEVEATYSLVKPDTLFGPKFNFAPSEGILQPGGLQAIEISFMSEVLGEFCEEFLWSVGKATEPLQLAIRGKVIGPTFRFNVPLVDFGVIPFGFASSKEIMLHNTSEIPMRYTLRVPGDRRPSRPGSSSSQEAPPTLGGAQEFVIRPRKGMVPPNCSQVVQLDLTPNQVRDYDEALVVDIKGVGANIFSLPIRANVQVPLIEAQPGEIDLGDCYLYYPYLSCVELINRSDLFARYSLQEQAQSDVELPLLYTSTASKGVIPAGECVKVPLQFEFRQSGEVDLRLLFIIAGSPDAPVEISVRCKAHGPRVKITPLRLNWGVCPVLTHLEKTFTIDNESLIPAVFNCTLSSEKPVFDVEPSSGSISPQSSQVVTVTAYVDDCLRFSDKLHISIADGTTFTVALLAEGRGTTIVSQPPLLAGVDLGPHFSNGPCKHQFRLTNHGRRMQALSWTTEGFSAARKKRAEMTHVTHDPLDIGKRKKNKSALADGGVELPVFRVTPDKIVLCPNQSEVVTVEGHCQREGRVQEHLLCHSIIGRNPLKELIMTVDMVATFINPLLEVSQRALHFTAVLETSSSSEPLEKEVTLKNVSPLHLTPLLETSFPFYLSGCHGARSHVQELSLDCGAEAQVKVTFDPSYCSDKLSRREEKELTIAFKEHSHKDIIRLSSEVHFPNLDFDSQEVDFGSVLNDTEKTCFITMINTSPIDVHYSWAFLDQPPLERGEEHDEGVDLEGEGQSQCSLSSDSEVGEVESSSGRSSKDSSESYSPPVNGEQQQGNGLESAGATPDLTEQQTTSLGEVEGELSQVTGEGEGEGQLSKSVSPDEEAPQSPVGGSPADLQPEVPVELTDDVTPESPHLSGVDNSQQKKEEEAGDWEGQRVRVRPKPVVLKEDPFVPISIQQVFDVLPLSGVLTPGQTQQIQLTFYGHCGLVAHAVAVCRVEGGPSYHVHLRGESAQVTYHLDRTTIDCGKRLYDRVLQEAVVLRNTGRVEFEYSVFGAEGGAGPPPPGQVRVHPTSGEVAPLSEQVLTVSYLPGTPDPFSSLFEIQIGHLEAQAVTLLGEGVFPEISLSCPRYRDPDGLYNSLKEKASALLKVNSSLPPPTPEVPPCPQPATNETLLLMDDIEESGIPPAESFMDLHASHPTCELEREMDLIAVRESVAAGKGSRPILPDYYLDFGYVVYGNVLRKTLSLTNVGDLPCTVTVGRRALAGTGFSVDLSDKIKALPEGERMECVVTFDPASVHCPAEETMAVLPLQVVGGPCYHLRLRGVVTLPDVEVSTSEVDFETVLCGQCKIVTLRLRNDKHVQCVWSAVTEKPAKKPPKHMPLHLKKKFKEKPPPSYFQVNPPSGVLMPGQFTDIQVKFTPAEEMAYSQVIPLLIAQNPTAGRCLQVKGQGCEPHIEFSSSTVEFGPILPYTRGDERSVVVHNPTPYPVEIYSLEFDKQYREEETILRWLKSCTKQKTLILPPLEPGRKLPFEITDAYHKEHPHSRPEQPAVPASKSALIEEEEGSQSSLARTSSQCISKPSAATLKGSITDVEGGLTEGEEKGPSEKVSQLEVGELESTPLTAAIARYMGIDLSPEAKRAELRRGAAVVVFGPPQSGCSTQARTLAERYTAALLHVDTVIKESIVSGRTPAGQRARKVCIEAMLARQKACEEEAAASALSVNQEPSKKHSSKDKDKEKEKEKEVDRSLEQDVPQPPPMDMTPFSVEVEEGTEWEVPEGSLLPTKLPEDIVVDILTERTLQPDCYRSVVVDGLHSQFIPHPMLATALVLKALGDRKHIYFVNLCFTYEAHLARLEAVEKEEERKKAEEEEAARCAEEKEKETEAALLALSEDEFESLPDDVKEQVEQTRHQLKKERLKKRQLEREERERQEQERKALEEAKRLEEEGARRGPGKRRGAAKGGPQAGKTAATQQPKAPAAAPSGPDASPAHGSTSQPASTAPVEGAGSGLLNTPVHSKVNMSTEPGAEQDLLTNRRKGKGKREESQDVTEPEIPAIKKWYMFYDSVWSQVSTLLEDWDRSIGSARPKRPPLEVEPLDQQKHPPTTTPKHKGVKGKKEKSEDKVLAASGSKSSLLPVPASLLAEENRKGLGVPVLSVGAEQEREVIAQEIAGQLPSLADLLDEMGLGPDGPPIQPPFVFSVVHCPRERHTPEPDKLLQFAFVAASPDDPNLLSDEPPPMKLPPETDLSESMAAEKEAGAEPSSAKAGKRTKAAEADKRSATLKSRRERRSSKSPSPASLTQTPPPEPEPVKSEATILESDETPKLVKFRWVIPPGGDKTLRMLFTSDVVGTVDQTLNFEILGTRRSYQLYCRGYCCLPTISKEPRVIFPTRRKDVTEEDIVHKTFIISSGSFAFGPLHCGRPRERHREGVTANPENTEVLTILNNSMLPSDISFCFQHDHNGTTFLLLPPSMTLNPGEKKSLTVWAFPKATKHYEDYLVGSIKNNPEPLTIAVHCDGVQPDIEVDKKLIEFGKVLLRRRETRQLHLRNNTLLPVEWKLSGHESMGDEFSFSAESGVVAPKTEFTLNVHFRAMKPNSYKRAVKLEVSDVEKYMGLMHTEAIQVHAEAYDVALDISFPRGADGGLDFQCLKVYEEAKLVCHLKNKGKYDIAYHFSLDTFEGVNLSNFFSISPSHSSLFPGDKAQAVSITFRADREIAIREQPLLKCQVMDMHLSKEGEVIACIPIKLSARSVFARYTITPKEDVNFGALVLNTRRTLTLSIENKGEFDFRYAITKIVPTSNGETRQLRTSLQPPSLAPPKRARSRESVASSSGRISQMTKVKRPEGLRSDVLTLTQRLVAGMFTIQPAYNTLQPGQVQNVMVEFTADTLGKFEEMLTVDISDRPKHEDLLTYKLSGEVLVPCINLSDVASIFEEHRICKHLGILGPQQPCQDGVGVYGEDNRKFLFSSVIVGSAAKARFKLSNPHKIPCDVSVYVKPLNAGSKATKSSAEGFEVEPARLTIPSHSHTFVTVTFRPPAMQTYTATFEAVAESSMPVRQRTLSFELQGEGNLPQVSVVRPSLRDGTSGKLMLVFKRLLAGLTCTTPLVLRNTGTIPAHVAVEVLHGGQSFCLYPGGSTAMMPCLDDGCTASSLPPVTSEIEAGGTGEFLIVFGPQGVARHTGELLLRIKDNHFENTAILLLGESYQDDLTIENIRSLGFDATAVESEQDEQESQSSAMLHNHLLFGDVPVGVSRQVSFTLTSRSNMAVYRFEAPHREGLVFSPSQGHLHPGASKEITVSLRSNKLLVLKREALDLQLCKITFPQPLSQVPDWDDRMRNVKWVTVAERSDSSLEPADTSAPPPAGSSRPSTTASRPPTAPAKRKVVETEPEPSHSVVEESQRPLPLVVSGIVDHCKYESAVTTLKFKDTLMYQTRKYSFPLKNPGQVTFHFTWTCLDDPLSAVSHTSLHLNSETGSVLNEGEEVCPFTIEPTKGCVPPGGEITMTLKFSPLDVRQQTEARFQCDIPHLDSSLSPLLVTVSGSSLMPYCHFELEESDYLTSGRRAGETRPLQPGAPTPAPRDISTKVIEFHSCGLGVKHVRRFNIVNPTNTSYQFGWLCEDSVSEEQPRSPFKCLSLGGSVEAGKKKEMVFEFIPTGLEATESSWLFSIPSLNISLPFLLVGITSEPAINIDRAYLNFRALLLGTQAKETVYLINNESTPYHFSFVESSLSSDSTARELAVEPMSGTVPANDSLPIKITFSALKEREYNFNLQCKVRRKPSPVTLNVKAEVYAISVALEYEQSDGTMVRMPEGKAAQRKLDMGTVQVNERSVCVVSIINNGRYSFEYHLEPNERCRLLGGLDGNLITVTPAQGCVEAYQRATSEVVFSPTSKMSLKGCELLLKIKNGHSLPITLAGKAVEPVVSFSFTDCNFGPCFVSKQRSDLPPTQKTLTITNGDKKDISVACFPPTRPYLNVFFEPGVVSPGESMQVVLVFHPKESQRYQDTVWFEVNGVTRVPITVRGQGVEMKVEVANPSQKTVNFGALRVGQQTTKTVKLVNQSMMEVQFSLNILPSSPDLLYQDNVLTVTPAKKISLAGNGGSCNVSVTFSPTARVQSFSEEVILESSGIAQPLFLMAGSCHGMEIALDSDHVPFGAVVLQSRCTRRVLMYNRGDIGSRFQWSAANFAPDFSITPTEGYISPGMEVPFEIVFHPTKVSQDIRYDKGIECKLEGGQPLCLTLTGMCIEQTPLKESLHFTANVRGKEKRQLTIHNRTHSTWLLHPIISGEHWVGPDTLTIDPSRAGHYDLTYQPMTMTVDSHKHQGSIFFPLPDGTGILYNLFGTAEPPKPAGTVTQEIPCKTHHTEVLHVTNWLHRPQRFRATIDLVRPERLDRTVKLTGLDYIDVPVLGKKDYRLNFYAHKEGSFVAKVTFRNEQTNEYLFYNVHFKATPPGIISSIDLSTPVRKSVSHRVTVVNPLPTQITFHTNVNTTDISLPATFEAGAESEGSCTFEYLPLKVGESVAKLTLSANELGVYQYELRLTATAPPPEKAVHFLTALGSGATQVCRFTSFAKGRTEYSCRLDNTDFHVERSVQAPSAGAAGGGAEVGVEVHFEPSHLGDTKATLHISSASGGDYNIPLFGHCLTPKPQGPFTIRAGSSINIPFKNIFIHPTQFAFLVDNPAFTVKANDTLKPKKTYNILVSYDTKQADPSKPKMGKLTVSCPSVSSGAAVQWTYYLKGEPHDRHRSSAS